MTNFIFPYFLPPGKKPSSPEPDSLDEAEDESTQQTVDEFTVQIQIIGSHGEIQTDTGLHCLSGEEGAPVFQPGQVGSKLLNHMAGKCTMFFWINQATPEGK